MSRIVIPIIIKANPEKYASSLNRGNLKAINTPEVIEKTITIHIIPNEFLSYESDSDFFDLVNIFIINSERNQREQIIHIITDHITNPIRVYKIYR